MHIAELETPALVVDLDIMEANLRKAADYSREHGLRLRPHTKTHKSPLMGRRQLALGAVGLTVAKVGEAEVMVKAGPPELLVAYPTIGARKLARLMEIAKRTQLSVALDSLEAARQLSEAANAAGAGAGILAEIDVGLGRVGVQPGPDLVELAEAIVRLPNVHLEGIAFYPGQIKNVDSAAYREMERIGQLIGRCKSDLAAEGIEVKIVSGGSTPLLWHSHCIPGVNEIRPGTYIFNDRNTVATGSCTYADCAAYLLTTVVSTAVPGQIIVDGGSKTFSSDRLAGGGESGFGYFPDAPGLVLARMNEEHGYVEISSSNSRFRVGDRLRTIPNHVCVVVNLHERVYGVRGEEVEEIWEVEGRGKLQ
ncbi:MAG: alanine racemase [Acidobacteria bacterium]|nr:alanine racemase [Acidobacteriota bacterium]